jgi:hypothetical protein
LTIVRLLDVSMGHSNSAAVGRAGSFLTVAR